MDRGCGPDPDEHNMGRPAKTVLFCTYLVVLVLLIKLNQIERILEEWRDGGDGSTSM